MDQRRSCTVSADVLWVEVLEREQELLIDLRRDREVQRLVGVSSFHFVGKFRFVHIHLPRLSRIDCPGSIVIDSYAKLP